MTPSTITGVALPVWIEENSWRAKSRAFFILALASVSRGWDMGAGVWDEASGVDERADLLAGDAAKDRMVLVEVEDQYRDVVVEAEREGGRVHDLEPLLQGVDEGDLIILHGVRVLLRVLVVDSVHLGSLDDDVRAHLGGP